MKLKGSSNPFVGKKSVKLLGLKNIGKKEKNYL